MSVLNSSKASENCCRMSLSLQKPGLPDFRGLEYSLEKIRLSLQTCMLYYTVCFTVEAPKEQSSY